MRRRAAAKKKKQKKDEDSEEFVVGPIQPKPPCFISLEDEPHEEDNTVDQKKREFKLIFPRKSADSITIMQHDIDRLEPGSHLNDNIIDFYLKYLKQNGLIEELNNRFYFFNTYFYTTLAKQSGLERVKKWTKDIDIFNYDFLMIPIHDKEHWRLVIVCYPGACENYNPAVDEKSRSALLLFDSLSWVDKKIYKTIRSYLSFEFENKRKKKLEFTAKNIPGIKPKVPVQDNNIDCGVFVLKYAEKFCTDPPDDFENPPQYIKWFGANDIPVKRQEVKNLLERLFAEEKALAGYDDDDDENDADENSGNDNGTKDDKDDNNDNGGDSNENKEKNESEENGREKNDENVKPDLEEQLINNENSRPMNDNDNDTDNNNNIHSIFREKMEEDDTSGTTEPKVQNHSNKSSPKKEISDKSRDELSEDDHSGPTIEKEDEEEIKRHNRNLLRQKLAKKLKIAVNNNDNSNVNSSVDNSHNINNTNVNNDSGSSLRSLRSSKNSDKSVNNGISNNDKNNDSKEEKSSNSRKRKLSSGNSSPRKKLARSKQNSSEEDVTMLDNNNNNSGTSNNKEPLERDNSVVFMGEVSSPIRRSSRVALKKSNK